MSLLPGTNASAYDNGHFDYYFLQEDNLQTILNPVGEAENNTSTPIPNSTPVVIATGTITLLVASKVWANSTSTFRNTATGSGADNVISVYHRINGTNYTATLSSIPPRLSSTIPSSIAITVQEITPVLAPGTYTVTVYASASLTNTTITESHTDLCILGNLV